MKCPNSFTCHICKQDFHSDGERERALAEHENRKKTVVGYPKDCNELVAVCDLCYQEHIAPKLMYFN